ncbi:nucleotide exchange factor GrpE [bacterium]|nr:MAG: nucleotide exchange factor GrpE [bacterium]
MTNNVKPKEPENTNPAAPSNADTEDELTEGAAGLDASEQTMAENNSVSQSNGIEDNKPESVSDISSSDSELLAERDEYLDRLQRKQAEFENYKRRTEGERQQQSQRATVQLITELLPVLDDFERALETATDTEQPDAYRTGIEQIYRKLTELLKKRGVTPIETAGKTFDPNFHEAVVHEESDAHRDGEIIEEYRRGYMLGSDLLRASMVKVAKA